MPRAVRPTPVPSRKVSWPAASSSSRPCAALTSRRSRWRREDIEEQTRLAFEAARLALKTVGATLDDVVKIAVFLKDMNDRVGFNKVWAETFPDNPPARYAIQAVDFGVVGRQVARAAGYHRAGASGLTRG